MDSGGASTRELRAAAREQPAPVSPAPASSKDGALCDLPDTAVEAIHFAPDEFNLYGRGEQILDGVLACQKAGLLGAEPLRVIGYTDPRGSAEFNRRLGFARAESVKRYLIRRGLPSGLLEVESRGESCHLGSGPETWRLDRRVEIHSSAVPSGQCPNACC
jgi:OOP family OmpA-OmpF porin